MVGRVVLVAGWCWFGGRLSQRLEWDSVMIVGFGTLTSLARVEWEHIQRILADCGGNISQAARVLRIHRRSLQRKLTKYPASR